MKMYISFSLQWFDADTTCIYNCLSWLDSRYIKITITELFIKIIILYYSKENPVK